LLQPQNLLVNTAAALAVSIFDGGIKRGEEAFARSYYEEMVETYGKTVLQAVREVEGALMNLETTQRRLNALNGVTRAALNKFKNSSDAFAAGALDQAGLLESRKNYQRVKDEAQAVKAELLRSYANLAYALGFGAVLSEVAEEATSGRLQKLSYVDNLRTGDEGVNRTMLIDTEASMKDTSLLGVELSDVFQTGNLLPVRRVLQWRHADTSILWG
jgi:hypothetical protein